MDAAIGTRFNSSETGAVERGEDGQQAATAAVTGAGFLLPVVVPIGTDA